MSRDLARDVSHSLGARAAFDGEGEVALAVHEEQVAFIVLAPIVGSQPVLKENALTSETV